MKWHLVCFYFWPFNFPFLETTERSKSNGICLMPKKIYIVSIITFNQTRNLYPFSRLEKLQRSGVQPSERLAFLGTKRAQFRAPWNPRASQHYRGIQGWPWIRSPLCRETLVSRTADVIFLASCAKNHLSKTRYFAMFTVRELNFSSFSIWKKYNCTDNLILIMNKTVFRLVHNRNKISHPDHIPFNLKGNGNIYFWVYLKN